MTIILDKWKTAVFDAKLLDSNDKLNFFVSYSRSVARPILYDDYYYDSFVREVIDRLELTNNKLKT